ncbi:hypothetical protein [Shimazuella kribbensis]|uniref:hypothetical protein n=1 Tax=Shimazuella kribbensis TaxID=139808 RepID=UPI0003F94A6C|nr:hypothetical protein [Shimazuella kribbensis]
MDNVSVALAYVIGAIKLDGYQLSGEQIDQLKKVLPELATTPEELEEKKLRELLTRMYTLKLERISLKEREVSRKRVKSALDNMVALEADAEAVGLLSLKSYSNASIELELIRKKMEKLLDQLVSDEDFNTSSAVKNICSAVNKLIYWVK